MDFVLAWVKESCLFDPKTRQFGAAPGWFVQLRFRCWLPGCCSVMEKVWFGSGFLRGETGFGSRTSTKGMGTALCFFSSNISCLILLLHVEEKGTRKGPGGLSW